MCFYIFTSLIYSWLLKTVISEIKCNKRDLPWREAMEECLAGGGAPVDYDRRIGSHIEHLDLTPGMTVWTSDFFSVKNFVSIEKKFTCQATSNVCEFVYLTNANVDFFNQERFYSECMVDKMYFCKENGTIRILKGAWSLSQLCDSFNKNQIPPVVDGYYWYLDTIDGHHCVLEDLPVPAREYIASCGAYSHQTGLLYRHCQKQQKALCDIETSANGYANFTSSCFQVRETFNKSSKPTINPQTSTTTNTGSITTISHFTTLLVNTTIDTSDIGRNSLKSTMPSTMTSETDKNGLVPLKTTEGTNRSPAENDNEQSQSAHSASVGQIVGIVFAIIVALIVAGLVSFMLARRGICQRKLQSVSTKSSSFNNRKVTRSVQADNKMTYDNASDRPYSLAVDIEQTVTYSKSTPGSIHIKDDLQTESHDDYDTTLQVRNLVDKQNNTYDTTTLKTQASENVYDTTLKTKEFHANNDDYNTMISMSVPSATNARPIGDEEEYDSISHTGHTPVVVDNTRIYNKLQ